MSTIIAILVSLLRAFVPAMVKASEDTAQDAASDTATAQALRDRIQKTWGKTAKVLLVLFCLCCTGCFTRTIYIPHGEPVRLRQELKGVKVWVLDSKGTPTKGEIDIPEGWYALPMEKPK
jgi:hypothetical protein